MINSKKTNHCFFSFSLSNSSDYIHQNANVPIKHLKKANGKEIFKHISPLAWPISHSTVTEINDLSSQLVDKHRQTYKSQKILCEVNILIV